MKTHWNVDGDWGLFMVSPKLFDNISIATSPMHYEIRDPSWFFYRLYESEWTRVLPSETPDAYFSTKRIPFFWLAESNDSTPIIYTRLKSPVDSNGVHCTWAEREAARWEYDIVVTNELLQSITTDTNGIPHIETVSGGLLPRLWADSFQGLEKMNFDIYSGTNLAHSMLFPASIAPEAPMLDAEEKAAFASWFRSCAATNGIPATNAVLAVFADDDFDGRMDAFASLDTPPDADGARPWAYCRNTEDGWEFFGADAPSSVTARTNEFFRVRFNGNDHGTPLAHSIVVIRPNPADPIHPLLPRDSAPPVPQPAALSPEFRNPHLFIRNYDEFFDLYEPYFFRLERIPVESIP